jgi:hypothetical protein
MRRALTLVVIALTACTGSAGTPTRSLAPQASIAVMVHRAGVGEPYLVQLVNLAGTGGSWVQATTRSDKTLWFPLSKPCPEGIICNDGVSANSQMPETSISSTHVYFLDGEAQIKSLARDGTVASVQRIDAPANSQVMFAVSPDDRRIAVSVVTLATKRLPAAFSDRMYVEDLATGLHRVDLYSSSTLSEWPVGWHSGELVVALGGPELGTYDNPYGAIAYVLVDPATGRRLQSIDCAFGLLVAAGSACASGALGKQAWDGTESTFATSGKPTPHEVADELTIHLSPDGNRIAEAVTDRTTGATSTIVFHDGSATTMPDVAPQGWLDATHLVVSSIDVVDVVDVVSGTMSGMTGLQRISGQGVPRLAGTLPANLG